DAGEIIHAGNLLLLGTGPFVFTDPGNDVSTLAANLSGGVSYSDSNSLSVGTVNGTNGVSSLSGGVNITASAEVSDRTLTVSQTIATNGNVSLSADQMVINSAVLAAGAATLKPTTDGREIDLGTNPSAGKLGISNSDLGQVSAAVVVIGSSSAGDITVTADINPSATNQLELVTGGGILDGGL